MASDCPSRIPEISALRKLHALLKWAVWACLVFSFLAGDKDAMKMAFTEEAMGRSDPFKDVDESLPADVLSAIRWHKARTPEQVRLVHVYKGLVCVLPCVRSYCRSMRSVKLALRGLSIMRKNTGAKEIVPGGRALPVAHKHL